MSVRLEDLPLRAQQQAMKQIAMQERERAERREKASKYHAVKDERATADGKPLRFDSKKEARRYDELAAMLRAGEIRDLKLQPQFTLQEAYTTAEGVRVRAIRYQADFSYEKRVFENTEHYECNMWDFVVEDVKSRATRTRVYLMKKKLLRERFGIEIREV